MCSLGSPAVLRRLGLPPLTLGLPPVLAGVPAVCGHKALPSAAGFRYNPHSRQATCLRLPVASARQTGAAYTGRAVQFNPFYPAGPRLRPWLFSTGRPLNKRLFVPRESKGLLPHRPLPEVLDVWRMDEVQ